MKVVNNLRQGSRKVLAKLRRTIDDVNDDYDNVDKRKVFNELDSYRKKLVGSKFTSNNKDFADSLLSKNQRLLNRFKGRR